MQPPTQKKGRFGQLFYEKAVSTKLKQCGIEKEVRMTVRCDPLTGFAAYLSEERARRKMQILRTHIHYEKNCDFCNPYTNTPEPRKHHEGGAVSVPNFYPWWLCQFVTIYPPFRREGETGEVFHRLFPSELDQKDLTSMVESMWDLANYAYAQRAQSFLSFMNWGPYAGASRQHPHSQFTFMEYGGPIFSLLKLEVDTARQYYLETGRNIYDDYIAHEEMDGSRKIYSNSEVYIGAPFAPRFTDEIIIIPKLPVSSVLGLESREHRQSLIQPAWGIFPFLYFYRSVANFNIVAHNSPIMQIDEDAGHGISPDKYYRMHFHIFPRRGSLPIEIAGAEVGALSSVLSKYPEDTAASARKWYAGPSENDVPKKLLREGDITVEVPDDELIEQFRACMKSMPQLPFYGIE